VPAPWSTAEEVVKGDGECEMQAVNGERVHESNIVARREGRGGVSGRMDLCRSRFGHLGETTSKGAGHGPVFTQKLFYLAGAGALAGAASQGRIQAQQEIPPAVPANPIYPYEARSPVALLKGEDRRKNVTQALLAVDREIGPAIKRKKYVVIKIKQRLTTNQLAATHVDALRASSTTSSRGSRGPW